MFCSVLFFAVGSAICGAAPSMKVLIAGRAVQGLGSAGIGVGSEMLMVDLIPLKQRGNYIGILGFVWAISAAVGPPIGGAFGSNPGQWRWLFYLNLPLCAISLVFICLCMTIKVPQTTLREKIRLIDFANLIFVPSATAAIIALSWAGSSFPWNSLQVIVPLCVGFAGLGVYFVVEYFLTRYGHPHPTVPFEFLSNPTSLIGFVTNFVHGAVFLCLVYYFPVYFQAVKEYTPLESGIKSFTIAFPIAAGGIICGVLVAMWHKYQLLNWIGWVLTVVGFGAISFMGPNSSPVEWICLPLIVGIGIGLLCIATVYPSTAPLKPEQQPRAMAFHAFTQSFGQVIGIAIGAAIVQSRLAQTLPTQFLEMVGGTPEGAFASILQIKNLPEPLKHQVKSVFANALRFLWFTMMGICLFSLLLSLLMRHYELTDQTDENWGMADLPKKSSDDYKPETKRSMV